MTATALDQTLSALADPTRRGVIDVLSRGPKPAGELAAAFDMSPPAMSRHLRVLRKGGLVTEEREEHDARVRLYRLRRDPFQSLDTWLRQVESFWTDQLDAFKHHAERKTRKTRR